MFILQSYKIAFRALAANKMRSSLTILGIVIGVAAVVALMAIGNGATSSITSSIEGIGSNLVTVLPGGGTIRFWRPIKFFQINIRRFYNCS